MRPLHRISLIVTLAAALSTGASLSIFQDRPAAAEEALAHEAEPMLPEPVTGDQLFASVPVDGPDVRRCMSADDILGIFALDIETVGGEIVMITDGEQQLFSDTWRRAVDGELKEVSLVLAHAVPTPDADPIFDVVEIDAKGCALSRTLLTADVWDDLIQRAAGYGV